jgi:hypothetical protein
MTLHFIQFQISKVTAGGRDSFSSGSFAASSSVEQLIVAQIVTGNSLPFKEPELDRGPKSHKPNPTLLL